MAIFEISPAKHHSRLVCLLSAFTTCMVLCYEIPYLPKALLISLLIVATLKHLRKSKQLLLRLKVEGDEWMVQLSPQLDWQPCMWVQHFNLTASLLWLTLQPKHSGAINLLIDDSSLRATNLSHLRRSLMRVNMENYHRSQNRKLI